MQQFLLANATNETYIIRSLRICDLARSKHGAAFIHIKWITFTDIIRVTFAGKRIRNKWTVS